MTESAALKLAPMGTSPAMTTRARICWQSAPSVGGAKKTKTRGPLGPRASEQRDIAGPQAGESGYDQPLNSFRMSWLFWLAIDSDWMPSCCWVCRACRRVEAVFMSASTRELMPFA